MPNIYILTWCKSLESLYGSLLVFQTLRVGFPTAPVYVFDNGSLPEAREAIREAAVRSGAVFTQVKSEVQHHVFLNGMINRQQDGAAVFVDPDICFWNNVEPWRFNALFAGRLIPCHREDTTGGIVHARAHTSLLWVPDVRKLREAIFDVRRHKTLFGYDPFRPTMFRINGAWHHYDTGASLVAAFPDRVHFFSERELDCYDHLFLGSHLGWVTPKMPKDVFDLVQETHCAVQRDYNTLRGTWRRQDKYFASRQIQASSGGSADVGAALTSIVIPCWNQLEMTRQCIAALKAHTRRPWELIVIDNGSTDGTDIYLAGVRDSSSVPVTVISNTTNRGFPAAINQGLKVARGEYLVMLNNDVVVTDGWLEQLIGLANAKRGFTAKEAKGGFTAEIAEHAETNGESNGGITADRVRNDEQVGSAGVDRDMSGARGIGVVGPMSNYAAPPQLVENVPYRDLTAMHPFARRWRDEHRGKWFTTSKLSGFCMLIKRAVYETVGGLDERFGLGFFDDDDFCRRAREAGFELAVAHDLFVHHFGSRTFQGNGVDAGKLLEDNGRRFAEKWGLKNAGGKAVTLQSWRAATADILDESTGQGRVTLPTVAPRKNAPSRSEGRRYARSYSRFPRDASYDSCPDNPAGSEGDDGDPTTGERATVSLTMIVRDEEENLPRCLESVRGLFDEIVVVDTGSVDRTKEIAGDFGAKVFDFVWIDDFAAARNEALAHATGDYAFWLDADDVVEPAEREKLSDLLGHLRPGSEAAAYVVRCACAPGPDGKRGGTVVDHVRLFPVLPGVRWSYRVHEQILPSLKRAKISVQWTDLVVTHTGYIDAAGESRKLDRNMKILKQELAEKPKDPFVLFNLGMSAAAQHGNC